MNDKKTVRVEIEFDDGSIIRVTGEEAQKWLDACNSQTSFCYAHGIAFPALKFEVFEIMESNKDEVK